MIHRKGNKGERAGEQEGERGIKNTNKGYCFGKGLNWFMNMIRSRVCVRRHIRKSCPEKSICKKHRKIKRTAQRKKEAK
jgi:hypothetical protein